MDGQNPVRQRTLQARDVQKRLGVEYYEWRELKASAHSFRRENIDPEPWGQLSRERRLEFCFKFRSENKYGGVIQREESDADPWCSWYLLSTAKSRHLQFDEPSPNQREEAQQTPTEQRSFLDTVLLTTLAQEATCRLPNNSKA